MCHLRFLVLVALVTALFSCTSAQYSVSTLPRTLDLTVVSGSVQAVVRGQINKNTDSSLLDTDNLGEPNSSDPYRMNQGTPTVSKTLELTAGDKFRYNIGPSETVTLSLTCRGDTDAVVSFYDGRTTKNHTVKKDSLVGLTLYVAN